MISGFPVSDEDRKRKLYPVSTKLSRGNLSKKQAHRLSAVRAATGSLVLYYHKVPLAASDLHSNTRNVKQSLVFGYVSWLPYGPQRHSS